MLIQEIKKRLKNAQEDLSNPMLEYINYRVITARIEVYESLLRDYKKQQEVSVEEVLAERCNEYMNKELIGWTNLLRGEEENPFPIGKTALENLIWKKELSLAQQVKLAEFFGLTLKITIQ